MRTSAGKTTLMRIIAGQEFATSGTVRVLGASPAESDDVLRRTVFVREDQVYPDIRVRHAIAAASWSYPDWSLEVAADLLPEFALPPDRGSRGCPAGCARRSAS